jgi:hypothetical protein
MIRVMAGLVPAIHVLGHQGEKHVNARDKPGLDEMASYYRQLAIPSRKRFLLWP